MGFQHAVPWIRPRGRRWPHLGLAVLVATAAGCKAPATTRVPTRSAAVSIPAPVASQPQAPGTPAPAAPLLSNNGSTIIANHGSSLIGRVTAPAGLVANNGGGVIANHGANRRLLATDEVPLAEVEVALQNADGTPVLAADGKAITARTDAQGNYVLAVPGIGTNQVVKVAVPAAGGDLVALAPKAATTVDVSFASTLVMGYILTQYVRTQPDPVATLGKLPPDLEAQALARAAAAVSAGQIQAPSLAPAALTLAIDTLRKADATLDQHLTAVKKLLVAAGQSDLGNGKPATKVSLSTISDVVVLPDGTVYLACAADARVWRLTNDGLLVKAIGRVPHARDASIEGKPGPEAAVSGLKAIAAAPDGSLLLLEPTRLSKLGPDGVLHQLWTGTYALAMVPRADGTVAILTSGAAARKTGSHQTPSRPATLLGVGKGPVQTLHSYTDAETITLNTARRPALGPDGSLLFGGTEVTTTTTTTGSHVSTHKKSTAAVLALDPTTFALTISARKAAGTTLLALDASGATVTGAGSPLKLSKGVTFTPSATADGYTPRLADFAPLVSRTDGSLLAASEGWLYEVGAAGSKLLAGMLDAPTQGPADEISFRSPTQLATDAASRLFVYDEATRHVWRIASGFATVTATAPQAFPNEDGAGVTVARMRTTPGGDLLVFDNQDRGRLFRVGADGTWTLLYTATADLPIVDFVATDTGLYVLAAPEDLTGEGGKGFHLLELDAAGKQVKDWAIANETAPAALAVGAAGTVYLAADTYLASYAPGGSLAKVDTSDEWNAAWSGSAELAVDARGRLVFSNGSTITRYDPATKQQEVLVGDGGRFFTGDGVDEGRGSNLACARFGSGGELLFLDTEYRQVKQVPTADLQ
ncbi:MAG: hypothetical protein JWM80_4020 [Cyanobacteria bacterium RYN_339]|nr:hypothetical protein [Cyanobacteria bacterium RYN_339]